MALNKTVQLDRERIPELTERERANLDERTPRLARTSIEFVRAARRSARDWFGDVALGAIEACSQ